MDRAKAIFRLISRNTRKGVHRATEEELLQEVIDELKDALESDIASIQDPSKIEDFNIKYPNYMAKIEQKAELFKRTTQGYRQICCVPAFALGLVMASRVKSHYIHAKWFKVGSLTKIIGVHGTVMSSLISVPFPLSIPLPSVLRRVHCPIRRVSRTHRESEQAPPLLRGHRGKEVRLRRTSG